MEIRQKILSHIKGSCCCQEKYIEIIIQSHFVLFKTRTLFCMFHLETGKLDLPNFSIPELRTEFFELQLQQISVQMSISFLPYQWLRRLFSLRKVAILHFKTSAEDYFKWKVKNGYEIYQDLAIFNETVC